MCAKCMFCVNYYSMHITYTTGIPLHTKHAYCTQNRSLFIEYMQTDYRFCTLAFPENCPPYLDCYPQVVCINTTDGVACGPCPTGFNGSGIGQDGCRKEDPCFESCYPDVNCLPQGDDSFMCGACPVGMTGSGIGPNGCRKTRCSDEPCYEGVDCTDTSTGFSCGPCPAHLVGNGIVCSVLKVISVTHCRTF